MTLRKSVKMSDQIRKAIDASGMSRYAICKAIGLSQSTMSRFMQGHGGLSVEMLDRIGELLALKIVTEEKAHERKGK